MTDFHVRISGNDRAAKGPWKTLEGARDGLRKLRSEGNLAGAATVFIHAGRYPLRGAVEFGPEDSHTIYKAAAGNGQVVFDGGEELAGWREENVNGRRAWVLELPEVAAGRRFFRSLFVNGQRRPRARLPKFSPDAAGVQNVFRIGKLRHPERRGLFDGDHAFFAKPGDLKPWDSLPDSEVVVLHYWIETRLGTPRFDAEKGLVECDRRSVFNLYESFNPKLARYYIDNLKEALTEPGEWYLDRRNGLLTYLPLRGEQLGRTRVVAPVATAFLRANGNAFNHDTITPDPFGGRPVDGLRFEGLTFRHADWFHPQADAISHNRLRIEDRPLGSASQGASNVPAAIEFRWARGCSLDRCTVENIGFTAVEFGPGCRDGSMTRCTIREVGAGGIRVDGSEIDGPCADRTGHIRIEDNSITDIGRVFHQGIGVLLMRAFNCRVAHNEIARTCYTGVSCGWSWGFRETISRDNAIENNLIHNIGRGVLSDMGAIYLLSVQPGTVVRGNHIHSVESADYGGWGIYPDEGASHILIENNLVHHTQGSPLRIHFGRELVVRNNVFADCRHEGLVGIGKAEGGVAATLMHNILLGPAPSLFEGGYAGDVRDAFRSDANIIWFDDGKIPPCSHPASRKDTSRKIPFARWQKAGHDRNSPCVDPKGKWTARSFVLPGNSPALKAGFKPYDWTASGPRRLKQRHRRSDLFPLR